MNTRTGKFPIGFRQGWQDWQKDLTKLLAWANVNELSGIDLGRDADKTGKVVQAAGLRIGSVDLKEWEGMLSSSAATRKKAIAANTKYIEACASLGPLNHFVVMLPEDPARPRAENFGYMCDSFAKLAPIFEACKARIVIEGWPGPGALCCTPEGYRAFFDAVPSKAMGVNYDPSHLLRMGIDPLIFLDEFIDRVYHVHGKDCELLEENFYEYGHEQPMTFGTPLPFGGSTWRYTIPGHGATRWGEVLSMLVAKRYKGMICIELEDANFNGSQESEAAGILTGAQFLSGV